MCRAFYVPIMVRLPGGKDAAQAVHNAVVLEEVAKMAYRTEQLKNQTVGAPGYLQDKHFFRKHGANAYYGQPGK